MPTLTAILGLVQAASAVLQLFVGGPSVVDLLNMQMELLNTIVSKLENIERGIKLILESVEEIKRLIGELPAQVVGELERRRIVGLTGTYIEIISAYQQEASSKGIAAAQRAFVDVLERDLLEPLRQERSTLLTFVEPIYIPSLSAALQAEVHGMILANYPAPRIAAALDRYSKWFAAVVSGDGETATSPRIRALRDARATLRSQIPTGSFSAHCLMTKSGSGAPGQAPFVYGGMMRAGVFEYVEADVDASLLASKDLTALLQSGQLTVADLPRAVRETGRVHDFSFRIVDLSGSGPSVRSDDPAVLPADYSSIMNAWYRTPDCTVERGFDLAKLDAGYAAYEKLREMLEPSGYSLIALVALQAAAQEALLAIEHFKGDPALQEHQS